MFGSFYRWAMDKASSPRAPWVLAMVSFAESAVLPLPVDAVSIPMMMADRGRVWQVALVGTLASVAGGIVGFGIGLLFFNTLGTWLLDLYGLSASFAEFQARFAGDGWIIVMVGGITPIPYKVVSIAAGVGGLSFSLFILFSAISRGVRFFGIALFFWLFGDRAYAWMERNSEIMGWIILTVLVLGFAAIYFF